MNVSIINQNNESLVKKKKNNPFSHNIGVDS